jgi:hypothetical protein
MIAVNKEPITGHQQKIVPKHLLRHNLSAFVDYLND